MYWINNAVTLRGEGTAMILMAGQGLQCRCLSDCPDGKENSTCDLKPNAKCYKKASFNEEGELEIHAGCLGSQFQYIDQCNKRAHPEFDRPTILKCCNNATMCNDLLQVQLSPIDEFSDGNSNLPLFITIAFVTFFVMFGVAVLWYVLRMNRREAKRRRQVEDENKYADYPILHGDFGGDHKAMGERMMKDLSLTNSGSGMPLLVQRTISRQIETVREIGRGRYGRVMLGKWREENVALKIFFSKDEDSWQRETEIYQAYQLRHENILGFIAADIAGNNSCTQMIIVTEYHERGSLYDYLQSKVVSVSEALKLAHSASAGLAHLHIEITGTRGKPAIAHRDVKTKNILVKRDGQCCISDMGLAVRYSRSDNEIDTGTCERTRHGTVRYMAPEVLMQACYTKSFDGYKASDVYGFALVMWEIINRTDVSGCVSKEHLLPYHHVVPSDPDVNVMREVVASRQIRPELHEEWLKHRSISSYTASMCECWAVRPESRLTMLRVRKVLRGLLEGLRPRHFDGAASDSSGCERKPSASSSTEPLTAADSTQSRCKTWNIV